MYNVSLINYGAKCAVVRRRTIDDKKTLAVLLEKSSYGTIIMKKLSSFFPPPFYAAIFPVHGMCRKVNSSFLYVPGIRRYQFGDSKESDWIFSLRVCA